MLSWLEDALRHESVLAITSGGTIDFIYRLSTDTPLHGGTRIYGSDNVALSSFEVDRPAALINRTIRMVTAFSSWFTEQRRLRLRSKG